MFVSTWAIVRRALPVWLHQLAKSPNAPQGGVGHSQGLRHLYALLANRLVASLAVIIASQKYTTLSSYVCLTVDSVLGDTLYSTVYNETFLYKINITKQKVTYQCNMAGDNPNCCGLYSMTFLLKEHPLICPLWDLLHTWRFGDWNPWMWYLWLVKHHPFRQQKGYHDRGGSMADTAAEGPSAPPVILSLIPPPRRLCAHKLLPVLCPCTSHPPPPRSNVQYTS